MDHKAQSKIYKFKDILTIIITVGTVVSMAVTSLNFLMLNKLQPFESSIREINKDVLAVKQDHSTFINKDLFVEYEKRAETRDNDIIHRLDILSGRLDRIAIK